MMHLIKRLFLLLKISKEVKELATIYTTLIIMGEKTFKQVPATLKEQVRNQLIVLEAEHLIIED